jgi:hypothetical protein
VIKNSRFCKEFKLFDRSADSLPDSQTWEDEKVLRRPSFCAKNKNFHPKMVNRTLTPELPLSPSEIPLPLWEK